MSEIDIKYTACGEADKGNTTQIESVYVLNTEVIHVYEHEMKKDIIDKTALQGMLDAIK